MAYIILPHRWRRQPTQAVGIDWSHPLSRGLEFFVGNRFDFGGRYSVTPGSLSSFGSSRGVLLNGFARSNYATLNYPKITAPPFSVFFDLLYDESSVAGAGFVSQGGYATSAYGWTIQTTGGSPGKFNLTYGGRFAHSDSTRSLTAGEFVRIGVVVGAPGGTVRYFVNGVFDSSRTADTLIAAIDNFTLIGAAKTDVTYFPLGNSKVGNVALYRRLVSDAEVLDEYLYLFDRLRPLTRRIYVPSAGTGGAVSVGAASETDAAQALAKRKTKALTNAIETGVAQAISRIKRAAVSVATEANAGQPIGSLKYLAVGHSLDVSAAQAVGKSKTKAVSVSTETNSAQSLGKSKVVDVAHTTEVDSAQAITRLLPGEQRVSVFAATETNSAQSLVKSKVVDVAHTTEVDSAQAITRFTPGVQRINVLAASESCSAYSVSSVKKKLVSAATETSAAGSIGRIKTKTVDLALEINAAHAISWSPKIRRVGVATENDLAFAITRAGVGLTDSQKITAIYKMLFNKQITDPATGIMTVYDDDDTTPLYTASIFEDAAGTIPYRGQGIDRREKLAPGN